MRELSIREAVLEGRRDVYAVLVPVELLPSGISRTWIARWGEGHGAAGVVVRADAPIGELAARELLRSLLLAEYEGQATER